MKLVAIVQTYNEMKSGNLPRCMESLVRYCDEVVVYDDGSSDNTFEYLKDLANNIHIIRAATNDFKNELAHKQRMINLCKELNADWILRMDADEVIEPRGETEIRNLLREDKTGWAFHMINLWRSPAFYRIDNGYNDVVFNRLWKVHTDLHFNVERGLHLTNYPVGATDNEGFADLQIIHYGFASDEAILNKYSMYKQHGQSGAALSRLIDEKGLKVRRSKQEWFKDLDVLSIDASYVFQQPIMQKVKYE